MLAFIPTAHPVRSSNDFYRAPYVPGKFWRRAGCRSYYVARSPQLDRNREGATHRRDSFRCICGDCYCRADTPSAKKIGYFQSFHSPSVDRLRGQRDTTKRQAACKALTASRIMRCDTKRLSSTALAGGVSNRCIRSGKRKWYSSRIVRSVERESGFAKHPNKLLNPARFARWTPNRYALGCRLA